MLIISIDLDNIDVKIYPQCCPGGSTERCKIIESFSFSFIINLEYLFKVFQCVERKMML